MAKTPPVPVPPGMKYCFMCEQPLALSAFSLRKGKPVSPCRACTKQAPDRAAAIQRMIEDSAAEMRAWIASRPPQPPEIERVYAPMDGFVKWLDRREARR